MKWSQSGLAVFIRNSKTIISFSAIFTFTLNTTVGSKYPQPCSFVHMIIPELLHNDLTNRAECDIET